MYSVGGCENQHTVMELFSISLNQTRDGDDFLGRILCNLLSPTGNRICV